MSGRGDMNESLNAVELDESGSKYNDSAFVLWYGLNHLSPIVVPVSITMLLSAILVYVVRPSALTDALSEGLTVYMVYKTESEDPWSSFWQAIVNAIVIVIVIALMTYMMVLLYKYKCTIVLYYMLYFSTFMSIGYTGWFVFYMICIQFQFTCDLITSVFVFFNLGVGSVICIFGTHVPQSLKKAFLVIISVLVCYLLSFFPDWTSWVLLVFMALYDLCAVLTKWGPLKLLLNLSQTRDDAIPGLLYEAEIDKPDDIPYSENKREVKPIAQADQEQPAPEASEQETAEGEEDNLSDTSSINAIFERESVKLGLGDFVFYSLMVSKAVMKSSVPFVFVFITILTGLLLTMALLSVFEMALPALPFSMILGVLVFVVSYSFVSHMINQWVINGIIV